MKPRLLDLFCGAGGAGVGYSRAGFEVVGVDIQPQPHYPFEFHQADALEYLKEHWREFDVIHASPPCQAYSSMSRAKNIHPDLYVPVRDLLQSTRKPYIIENVVGAPYNSGIILCGSMFGMKVQRHRNFETSWLMFQPQCNHGTEKPFTITGCAGKEYTSNHSRKPNKAEGPEIMGMPWATWDEVTQAIPPAYTEFIGSQIMARLTPHGADSLPGSVSAVLSAR